jgi:hypothetical protein
MPIVPQWKFVCPVTGVEAVVDSPEAPEGWGTINNEHVAPQAQPIIANRVLFAIAQVPPLPLDGPGALAPATDQELASVGLPPRG